MRLPIFLNFLIQNSEILGAILHIHCTIDNIEIEYYTYSIELFNWLQVSNYEPHHCASLHHRSLTYKYLCCYCSALSHIAAYSAILAGNSLYDRRGDGPRIMIWMGAHHWV